MDKRLQRVRAVSPAVGVILMVAITVIFSAVVGITVLDFAPSTSSSTGTDDLGVRIDRTATAVTVTVITGTADQLDVHVDGEVTSEDSPTPGTTYTVDAASTAVVRVVSVSDGERRLITTDDPMEGSVVVPSTPTATPTPTPTATPTPTPSPGATDVLVDFENGLTGWSSHSSFSTYSSAEYVRHGEASGGVEATTTDGSIISERTVYDEGARPSQISFYWKETEASKGGGLRFINSNGNPEVSFATQNPQWTMNDGGSLKQTGGGGDSYNVWTHVTITFNWDVGTYAFEITDGTNVNKGTFDMRHGDDISTVRISNIKNTRGGWSGDSAMEMWFDDIEFTK